MTKAAFMFHTDTLVYKTFKRDGKFFLRTGCVNPDEVYDHPELVEIPFAAYHAIRSAFNTGVDAEQSRMLRILGLGGKGFLND